MTGRRTAAVAALTAALCAFAAPVASQAGEVRAPGRPPSGPCALRARTPGVSEGARTPRGFARSHGTVRAVTFFIDFPDAPARISPRQRYAEFFPAVARHFRTASYGRLDYRSTPVPRWIRMAHPYRWYGITRAAAFEPGRDDGYAAIAREILAAADDEVDFRRYDLINVLATPQAGPPATRDVRSVTFAGGPTGLRTDDGVPFRNASFIWSRQTGDSPYRVLVHENAHAFGLPDLYATATRTPVGHWDPMDEDWGPSNDFLAWHKWKLGWLARREVLCLSRPGSRTLTLTSATRPGGTKLAVVPLSPARALTLEARAPGRVDHLVCRPGVLLSLVATDLPSGAAPVRTIDATPGSRGCHTTDPNVTPALTDAPFRPGESWSRGPLTITVLARPTPTTWRLKITRRPARPTTPPATLTAAPPP
ncbi:M6 family metalloprotease domain-containing protein [Streptomyces mashuensis]|uniref:M6 family metalloprotease domain-containing protein n=1 Tax=Streptomyces mashuensis TaxID=33904 RepID=A0A919EEX7_9ACTN|nr:M6 family metalloprotease domain-containing protein [Streptomyces mashuensis]GHF58204.1 M6 family metalloprotease domain-containing protein [Streptomyces mashuensis]